MEMRKSFSIYFSKQKKLQENMQKIALTNFSNFT